MLIGAGPWAARHPPPPPTPRASTLLTNKTVVTGLADIATTVTAFTPAAPPTTKFAGSDAVAITDAYHSFTTAEAKLIGALAKSGDVVKMVPAIGPAVTTVAKILSVRFRVRGPPPPPSPFPPIYDIPR